MNAFNVWLRFLRDICRVRVDGIENAKWLLDRLSQSGNVRISAQFSTLEKLSGLRFEVLLSPRFSRSEFVRLLAAIPEVNLKMESERESAIRLAER